jgi:hypothetical protein
LEDIVHISERSVVVCTEEDFIRFQEILHCSTLPEEIRIHSDAKVVSNCLPAFLFQIGVITSSVEPGTTVLFTAIVCQSPVEQFV